MQMMTIKRVFCLGGMLALLLTGCATTQTTSSGAVGVERGQTMLLSSSEVNRSAATAYKSTIDSARSKGQIGRAHV